MDKNEIIWKNLNFNEGEFTETGHFSGYANTWDVDMGGDRFLPGAFKRTIKANKGKVPILKGHDSQLEIGMSLQLSEDEVGLRVNDAVLYIDDKNPKNEMQAARDEYVRLKRRLEFGRPLGLSVGVTVPDGKAEWVDERKGWDIKESALWEFSTATFQMNLASMATSVKSILQLPTIVNRVAADCTGPLCPSNKMAVMSSIKALQELLEKAATTFSDLPLADENMAWDAGKARARVATWSDGDMKKYAKAFFWYDSEAPENLTSYKLPFADVLDGSLRAVPRGVMAAAAVIQGSRGGADIPEADVPRIKAHIAKYYDKMGKPAPWQEDSLSLVKPADPAQTTPPMSDPNLMFADPEILHSTIAQLAEMRNKATSASH